MAGGKDEQEEEEEREETEDEEEKEERRIDRIEAMAIWLLFVSVFLLHFRMHTDLGKCPRYSINIKDLLRSYKLPPSEPF